MCTVNSGYQEFKSKNDPAEAAERKRVQAVEQRIRPDNAQYFIAAETFEGWKWDYIFTTKDRGTGYYWDGMDSLKKHRGELNEEGGPSSLKTRQRDDDGNVDGLEPKKKRKKKKKKKTKGDSDDQEKEGDYGHDQQQPLTPHPMEQIAAAMHRQRQRSAIPSFLQQPASKDNSDLPAGWETAKDPTSGKTYFFERATGKRQWDKPKSMLPEGWMEAKDASTGKTYYYHKASGQTKWEKPTS